MLNLLMIEIKEVFRRILESSSLFVSSLCTFICCSAFQVMTDIEGKQEWKDCLDIPGVRLPQGYYFGASSATGDLSGLDQCHSILVQQIFRSNANGFLCIILILGQSKNFHRINVTLIKKHKLSYNISFIY